jgi:hypothetical protein
MASCRKARLVEPQDWPHQPKFMPATAARATAPGSASAKLPSAWPVDGLTFAVVPPAAWCHAPP